MKKKAENLEEIKKIEALVNRARIGDQEAFGDLYTYYLTPIYRYIYYRVKNEQEAEDLTQTVFIKAWDAIKRYEHRGFSFTAWLYTIARNIITDFWKKKKSIILDEPLELNNSIPAEHFDLEEQIQNKGHYEFVNTMVEKLSEEQKNIINLKFFNELSNKEIAELTGKTETAIRSLQYRALKALSELLRDYKL